MSTSSLTRVLLFPLHLSVIVSLHACFASCRLAYLVSLLLPSSFTQPRSLPPQPSPATDLAQARWQKVPTHLAVRLAPSGGGRGFWRRRDDERGRMVKQVGQLVGWSRELGIQTLTVYDESGLLVRNAEHVAELVGMEYAVLKSEDVEGLVTLRTCGEGEQVSKMALEDDVPTSPSASDAGRSGSSTTLVETDSSPPSSLSSPNPFSLNLVSRSFGRPQLARVAQRLARERTAIEKPEELSSEAVSAILDALPLSEPDLLCVFGGPYLRLQGFPPWQIRLSEMYHHSSPTWLPSPPLTYRILRNALDAYGKAEMRLGR